MASNTQNRPRQYHSWTKQEEKRIAEFMSAPRVQDLADELNVSLQILYLKISTMKKTGKLFRLMNEINKK